MFIPNTFWMFIALFGIVVSAVMAVRATRLLVSALWLIAVSILTAVAFSLYGAVSLAVLELSVGAGLVAVLLLFAISIAGDETDVLPSIVPRWLAAAGIAILFLLVLAALSLVGDPFLPEGLKGDALPLILWDQRAADVVLQLALIFTGALTILALLAEKQPLVPASALVPARIGEAAEEPPDAVAEAVEAEEALYARAPESEVAL